MALTYRQLDNMIQRVRLSVRKHKERTPVKKWCKKYHAKLTNDQIHQVREYWKPYTRNLCLAFHTKYTAITGKFDVRYIPDDLYYFVIGSYLSEYASPLANKSYMPLLFSCKMPFAVFHKINGFYLDHEYHLITEEQAIALCRDYEKVILKPSLGSWGGKKVTIISGKDATAIREILTKYKAVPSLIVQDVVKQHHSLSAIHESSINTIRVITLLMNNEVYVLHPVLRMGVNNSVVDNASSGGIISGIMPDGRLKNRAYSAKGVCFDRHPQGFVFENCTIPSYEKVLELARTQAPRLPNHRLIGWDIAVGEDGEPILIEANLASPGLEIVQDIHGPIFGDLTESVLKEVFKI